MTRAYRKSTCRSKASHNKPRSVVLGGLALFLFSGVSASWCQAPPTNKSQTTGSCSPAISGTENHVTMTCTGVSKEKAEQLVRLLNEILDRELDPRKVYAQLDQIRSDVGALAKTLNPLADAPPEVIALVNESQRLALSCSSVSQNWRNAESQILESSALKPDPVRPARENPLEVIRKSVDDQFLAKYKSEILPQLTSWRVQFSKQVPELPLTEDWTDVHNRSQLHYVCEDITHLRVKYAHLPSPDPHILGDAVQSFEGCKRFERAWSEEAGAQQREYERHSHPAEAVVVPPAPLSGMQTKTAAVDAEQALAYRKSLAPQLLAWRAHILAQVSGVSSSADYQTVSNLRQMSQVCLDVLTLSNAYRAKLIEEYGQPSQDRKKLPR